MANLSETEAQDAYDREVANISVFAARISELCKYVWGGSLAIFYALATAEPTSAAYKFVAPQRSALFVAASAGALAFLCDYLQVISAYLHAHFLAHWIENTAPIPAREFNRRTSSLFSRANSFFFFSKNIAVLVTAGFVAYAILAGFLK